MHAFLLRICECFIIDDCKVDEHPCCGCFAGGVLQDAMLAQQTFKGLREVFAPKLGALHAIVAANSAAGRAAIVMFSSIASLLGSPGQGNYAAANAAMDASAIQDQSKV